MQAWLGRIAANAVIAGILVAIVPMGLRGQSADEVKGFNKQIVQLYGQGRYAEATATALQALALAERTLGMEHPDTVAVVNNLAALYFEERDWARAVQLWRRGAKRALSDERPLQELVALGLNQLVRFRGGAFAKR